MLWALLSEIFPNRARAAALGALSSANALCNLASVASAPAVLDAAAACDTSALDDDGGGSACDPARRGRAAAAVFLAFATLATMTDAVVLVCVPETTGLTLEAIEAWATGRGDARLARARRSGPAVDVARRWRSTQESHDYMHLQEEDDPAVAKFYEEVEVQGRGGPR